MPDDTARGGSLDDSGYEHMALVRFDLFLIMAVATVLVVRAFLALTGYPQIGGDGLHIAHMLWGGLLMAIAIIVVLLRPGSRVKTWGAVLGGAGFGLFIDEVGKFVTDDNDYFFEPAIAIMYAVFVLLYLFARGLVNRRPLTDSRRIALGAMAVADHELGQLDEDGARRARRMLSQIDDDDPRAPQAALLSELLASGTSAKPGPERWITDTIERTRRALLRMRSHDRMITIVIVLCVLQAVGAVIGVLVVILTGPQSNSDTDVLLNTGLPGLVAAGLLIWGTVLLFLGRRAAALRFFELSILINLLFTQIAVFNRQQFLGLVGFTISALAMVTLRLDHAARSDLQGAPAQ